MKFEVNKNIININTPLISINDSEELLKILQQVSSKYKSLIININNSFSLPSTIIGELELLRDKNIEITINVKDEILFELFQDLKLDEIFNINFKGEK